MTYQDLLLQRRASSLEAEAALEKQLLKAYKLALKEVDAQYAKFVAALPKYDLAEARKYDRFGKLQAEIKAEIARLEKTVINVTTANQYETLGESYYGTQWATDQALGQSVRWGVYSKEAIEAAVYNEFSGATFITTIKKNINNNLDRVFTTLTRSLASGSGYRKTAQELKAVWEGEAWKALRVLRTEGAKAYSIGNLDATLKARAQGIEIKRRWIATRDDRTRDAHAMMDGQLEDKDGYFHDSDGVSYLAPGISDGDGSTTVNCRCDIVDEIVGEDGQIDDYTPWPEWEKANAKPLR